MDDTRKLGATQQNVAMGYLRAFVTVLVVAHHAVLAYHPYAPPPPESLAVQPMLWPAFPVVDSHHLPGSDLFVGFNDIFFMPLMFLLSGLFVWPSLRRRGPAAFLRARLRRLGIPFVVSAALLAPLAYLPTFLQTGARFSLGAYWHAWRSLPFWPAGPAWFLWVLLVFGVLVAGLSVVAPRFGEVLGRWMGRFQRPASLYCLLVCLSAVAYVPLALGFGPGRWTSFGPFSFQTSRILLYATYFSIGIGLGASGPEHGWAAPGGALARRWWLWAILSVLAFLLEVGLFLGALAQGPGAGRGLWAAVDAGFVVSCAASSFALLALFARYARPGRMGDSLSANAYGIYVMHYVFVSWLQYALLGASLPGAAKATAVFLGALVLSWGMTVALRRVPAVSRVVSAGSERHDVPRGTAEAATQRV